MSSTQTFSNQIYRDGSSLYPFNNVTFNSVTIPPQSSLNNYVEATLNLDFAGPQTVNLAVRFTRIGNIVNCTIPQISGAFLSSIFQSTVAQIPASLLPTQISSAIFTCVNNNLPVVGQVVIQPNGQLILGLNSTNGGVPLGFAAGAVNVITRFTFSYLIA